MINSDILKDLQEIFSRLCRNAKSELVEFNGESDHVHLLVDISPDLAPSRLVNTLKTISSRMIRKKYSEHVARFIKKDTFWTGAYFVISCGSAHKEVIKKYIDNQNNPN